MKKSLNVEKSLTKMSYLVNFQFKKQLLKKRINNSKHFRFYSRNWAKHRQSKLSLFWITAKGFSQKKNSALKLLPGFSSVFRMLQKLEAVGGKCEPGAAPRLVD
jgi:hypothetical protein